MDEWMVSGREEDVAVYPPGALPMGAGSGHWECQGVHSLPQLCQGRHLQGRPSSPQLEGNMWREGVVTVSMLTLNFF